MVNKRLKLFRKEIGLTQTEFGEILGKTLRTVQTWESGERNIPESVIRLMSVKFNMSEEWLKTGNGSMYNSTNGSQSVVGNYGINIQNGNITFYGTTSNPLSESFTDDVKELFELILDYGTPKIVKQFKSKMLDIKKLHEE